VRRTSGVEIFFQLRRIKVQRVRIDVKEDGSRSRADDCTGGGEETERSGDDVISGTHSGSQQGQPKSIRARGAADSVRCSAKRCQLPLKSLNFLAKNVVLGRTYPLDGRENLFADGGVLSAEIEQRDRSRPTRGFRSGRLSHERKILAGCVALASRRQHSTHICSASRAACPRDSWQNAGATV
jgi:hypothetical protein